MSLIAWKRTITDDTGNIVPGASVEVRRTSNSALADLFSDTGGTPLSNPFTADGSTAEAEFFAEPDQYSVDVTSGGDSSKVEVNLVDARQNLTFETRALFAAWRLAGGSVPSNSEVIAGGISYIYTANPASPIPDILGYEPLGDVVYLEHWGYTANGVADALAAFNSAVAFAGSDRRAVGFIGASYRFSTTPMVPNPVTFIGSGPNVTCTVENGNTEEGFLVLSPNVHFENFTIEANASTEIINGTGEKGTCVTVSRLYTSPDLPEPVLVHNVTFKNMRFTRRANSESGHAVTVAARSSGIVFDGCEFIGGGSTAANGFHPDAVLIHWGGWSHGSSTHSLNFDAQTANFQDGETVTGSTSGATAYIVKQDDIGASGTLYLRLVRGDFQDNETITSPTGIATANGTLTVGDIVQARFEPNHYSHHPNNIRINNCRVRNCGRIVVASAAYDVKVTNIDYAGPASGGQLIDFVVGDEAETFAHPDDFGRVYRGLSFDGISAHNLTGSGEGSNTAIDGSGFGTSKQTAADLAGYANLAEYNNGERYAGTIWPVRRQVDWQVGFSDMTFEGGPGSIYVAEIRIRNMLGQFSFNRVRAIGASDIVGASVRNMVGQVSFTDCELLGGLDVQNTQGFSATDSRIRGANSNSGTANVFLDGDLRSATSGASVAPAGAESFTLSAPSVNRISIGRRILYGNNVAYTTNFVDLGDTTVECTPLPVQMPSSSSITFDELNRNIRFENCDIRAGDECINVQNSRLVRILGGQIRDGGQYGILANANSEIVADGVIFENNGLRRATEGSLSTRDILASTGSNVRVKDCRFQNSNLIDRNVVSVAGVEKFSLKDNVFAGSPVSGFVSAAAQTNNEPAIWVNNVDAAGSAVFLSGTWTPQLRFSGATTGITTSSSTAQYTVYDDRVFVDYDFTLSSKGTATGSATIAGLPFAADTACTGTIMMVGVSGLSGGAVPTRITSNAISPLQQTATSVSSISDTNFTDTSRLIGSITYRRS